jgi:hypothetical protein
MSQSKGCIFIKLVQFPDDPIRLAEALPGSAYDNWSTGTPARRLGAARLLNAGYLSRIHRLLARQVAVCTKDT